MEKELIVHKDPKSPISEVFRTLRTNMQFINIKKDLQTILVTSTFPGEGKSWISSNLAISFAQAGKNVVLIDSDMRKGRQNEIFEVFRKPGLSNYLSTIGIDESINKKSEISKCVQKTEIENLYVITAGNIPPNPSELLMSDRIKELLEELKESFDLIIIDGTPCDLVTDSLILAKMVDSTIVVAAHKSTKKDKLKKVVESIKSVGGKSVGVILNKVPISAKKYEETYYYGSKK